MYAPYPENMMESIKKVEATRAERMATEPRRLSADEKDALLKKFHPDYNPDAFAEIKVGPNKGQKAPLELTKMLHSESRLLNEKIDLTKIDYDVDVLIIGGGGAGSSCAIEAHNAGANVMIVTKLRIGDANTMMAEGGIQAADKENDSPVQHYLDCFGGGHFAAKPELVKRLVMEAPDAIKWLNDLGVEFDKAEDGTMVTTHGGGTSRKRMHAAKDYSGSEIMRTIRDEVLNLKIPVVEFTSAVELLKDEKELAEHNMLVDLGRNDIGKISEIGTVEVEKYMEIQKFSHVMHIGSTVHGKIREGKDAVDTVDAILPAGTLSGAPKIKACQIINELEDLKRGIYGGAIGYLDFTGNLDTCIAIRMAYAKNGKVFVCSGAGIVADSIPENEFQECINKAKAVTDALQISGKGEAL